MAEIAPIPHANRSLAFSLQIAIWDIQLANVFVTGCLGKDALSDDCEEKHRNLDDNASYFIYFLLFLDFDGSIVADKGEY